MSNNKDREAKDEEEEEEEDEEENEFDEGHHYQCIVSFAMTILFRCQRR